MPIVLQILAIHSRILVVLGGEVLDFELAAFLSLAVLDLDYEIHVSVRVAIVVVQVVQVDMDHFDVQGTFREDVDFFILVEVVVDHIDLTHERLGQRWNDLLSPFPVVQDLLRLQSHALGHVHYFIVINLVSALLAWECHRTVTKIGRLVRLRAWSLEQELIDSEIARPLPIMHDLQLLVEASPHFVDLLRMDLALQEA